MTDQNALKRAVAAKALSYVRDGMKLGLGSGSTAEIFVELLAAHPSAKSLTCVPTSEKTAALARKLGLTLAELDDAAPLDLTIDGADEADRDLNLIKGGGGMLLREKIVAAASRKMVVIADQSKLVAKLGKFPLPVEVVAFGHKSTVARLASVLTAAGYAGVPLSLRQRDGAVFKTDGGNVIYDIAFGAIRNAPELATTLSAVPGVVEHGLFIGIATTLLIAGPDGTQIIELERGK